MSQNRRSAFTLMELIVAMGISVLAGFMIYQFMAQSSRQYRQSVKMAESQKDLMMVLKYLQSDLAHLREYQEAEPRYFRRELKNLFEVQGNLLSFATCRGEKITYIFDPNAFMAKRKVEILKNEELSIKDLVIQKIKERAQKTFTAVTDEVRTQVNEKIDELKDVLALGDPNNAAGDPAALTQKCTAIFDKLTYYTGTDGSDSGFVKDLKEATVGKAEKMASDIGYGVESDAEEVMGTILTRYFQMEELAPPKMGQGISSERIFRLKGSYRVLLANAVEKPPSGLGADDVAGIMGFRFFLESPNPISALEQFYRNRGVIFAPNALLLRAEKKKSQWNTNPPPRVKLKIMDLMTKQELTGRYYGEAIIPDANILYKSWVEIPEFWFLDIFNTEEEVEKLRKGLINPDDAEPKK